jgi:ATP-dependent helicase/nuclease subunit A
MQHAAEPQFHPYLSIHASAGSGKTYQLISRIVYLLLNGARPGAILAITFTRKAAGEMQQRLLERVATLAVCPAETLARELQHLGLAPDETMMQQARCLHEALLNTPQPVRSTTFHAFCQDLLRRFPLEADVPPGFELMERTGTLAQQAWEALCTELTQQPDSPLAAAMDFMLQESKIENVRRWLNAFLQHRSDWWAYTRNQPDRVDTAINDLATALSMRPEIPLLKTALQSDVFRNALTEFANLLAQHNTQTNEAFCVNVETALDSGIEPEQALDCGWTVFFTNDGDPRKRKPSKAQQKSMGIEGEQRFLALHDQLCDEFIKLRRLQSAEITYAVSAAWFRVGDRYLQHYQRIKREQRVLDFTDLEWMAYQLLNYGDNAEWVQYKMDERIDHLLIDEFQDTNPTQWQLVLPLLRELAAGEAERQRSVFLVGDAKQSIYKFRRAEPRLLKAASDWLRVHLHGEQQSLSTSWRSSPAIIDLVNQLFGQPDGDLMLEEFEHHSTQHTQLWGRVVLLPLASAPEKETPEAPEAMRNPLRAPRAASAVCHHYHEGRAMAGQIQTLMEARTPIGPSKQARALRYSDIIILIRNRTHIGEYERALREAHIPYLGTERGALLNAPEVQDMVNLLRWLITPYDNLALAGILRSPLFCADDTHLMMLAGKGNWFDHLQTMAEDLPGDHPLGRACHHLTRWSELSDMLPVHDLLDRIYSEANVLARYHAAFPEHLRPRVQANLARFVELALELDSGRYPSLTRYLNDLAVLQQQPDDAPDAPPGMGHQDRVQILTIHAAKGLEAPVVFLADAAHGQNTRQRHEVIVDWPVDAPTPTQFYLAPSRPWPAELTERQQARQQQEQQREETDLLYVALTRAEQLLFISGTRTRTQKDFGWYAQIARRYGHDIEQLDEAVVLEEANTAPEVNTPDAVNGETIAAIDARLQQPLTVTNQHREIAPSHTNLWEAEQGGVSDEDARQRGIVIHGMLQTLCEQPAASLEQLRNRTGALATDDALLRQWWQEAQAVIGEPSLRHLFDPELYEQAYNEVPIYFQHQQRTVHGVVDRLVVCADKLIVIDYKTHVHAHPDRLAALATPYQSQMAWYREGVRRLWPGREIEAALLFTACRALYPVPPGVPTA